MDLGFESNTIQFNLFLKKKNSFVQFLDIFLQKLHLHNSWTTIVEYGNFKIATAAKFHYHLILI